MIGKVETMGEDVNYISTHLPALAPFLKAWPARANAANVNKNFYAKLWRQLSEGQRTRLCDLYEDDFELFDYKCDIEAP